MTRTVLLTAFEPFGGAASNPSMAVVDRVAHAWDRSETFHSAVLPVAYRRAAETLDALLRDVQPDVVVSVGVAAGRERPSLERLAVNLCDARIPDNDGAQPLDEQVLSGAPLAVMTTLPVRATYARLRESGLDVELSMTAGTFVCNAVFYRSASWSQRHPGRRAGFVHVPQGRLDESSTTVRAVLDDALDLASDLVMPTGETD